MFINVWKQDSKENIFLNENSIARISFCKDDSLKSCDRCVKVQFTDGSTGTYFAHRNVENGIPSYRYVREKSKDSVGECVETSVEELAVATV